ncbi:nitrous oxide reductase family maturation protein NosD [Paracoccus sp. p4-l81]|uniref:nitrous oxide reductase family maturation protein NosD n=1 Tax=Paracoccus sp. p4-l81 TaxID=3342806 RepID=UPI0035B84E18
MIRIAALALLMLTTIPAMAGRIEVAAGGDALQKAIAGAAPGDVLVLALGDHQGPVTLDRPLTLTGQPGARIDGQGRGSVITITGADTQVTGLILIGSGDNHSDIDSGVRILKGGDRAVIRDNRLEGNLYGIDVHGGHDVLVERNTILGRQDARMNDRGNGVYVWNAPGLVVQDNDIRWGRDGIFTSISRKGIFRRNLFRDLRFAVHYMSTNDSEVSGNISIGNHLGYAIMYSDRVKVLNNLSLKDRSHGVMLNYANGGDVMGNLVRGGAEKCTFIYNAHKNLIAGNRFEGCDIGIHFTAGSERNAITGNAFVGNREQVKYVGSRDLEWSLEGRGNYWSDHPAFDLNGDGIADSPFRPNDLMDHILWSQPAAALLTGSPAVQLIRWSQSSFPATLPGGVVDSFPLVVAPQIAVPDDIAAREAAANPPWLSEDYDDAAIDPLSAH